MDKGPKMLLRRCMALILVVAIATSGTWLIDAFSCLLGECVEDDASRRADALIGYALVVAYAVLTLAVVFLPSLVLKKFAGRLLAAVIPSAATAIVVSILLFRPEIDSVFGLLELTGWLAFPWFVANLTGLAIWPRPASDKLETDTDCYE